MRWSGGNEDSVSFPAVDQARISVEVRVGQLGIDRRSHYRLSQPTPKRLLHSAALKVKQRRRAMPSRSYPADRLDNLGNCVAELAHPVQPDPVPLQLGHRL